MNKRIYALIFSSLIILGFLVGWIIGVILI